MPTLLSPTLGSTIQKCIFDLGPSISDVIQFSNYPPPTPCQLGHALIISPNCQFLTSSPPTPTPSVATLLLVDPFAKPASLIWKSCETFLAWHQSRKKIVESNRNEKWVLDPKEFKQIYNWASVSICKTKIMTVSMHFLSLSAE